MYNYNMKILGIETSCDETAAAVVEDGTKILSNVVASSVELHKKTGGIIPEVAAREQVKCMIPVIQEAIEKLRNGEIKKLRIRNSENKISITQLLNYSITNIDAIAVTYGPGLIGSLLIGIETAKTLSYLWKKPIIPVNHLLAHIYANFLNSPKSQNSQKGKPQFPAIVLIASGGHTELILMKDHGKFTWLGGTRDDAAGEAFDKIARLLGLGFPGGPAIAAEAAKFEIRNSKFEIKLPRPMINDDNLDFSFSGLKTATLRLVKPIKSNESRLKPCRLHAAIADANLHVSNLAASVQEAITDVLVVKTLKAAQKFKVKSILLSGGVAANQRLREKMKEEIKKLSLPAGKAGNKEINFFVPPPNLCTDNAAAIASCAFFNFKPVPWNKITPFPSLEIGK